MEAHGATHNRAAFDPRDVEWYSQGVGRLSPRTFLALAAFLATTGAATGAASILSGWVSGGEEMKA